MKMKNKILMLICMFLLIMLVPIIYGACETPPVFDYFPDNVSLVYGSTEYYTFFATNETTPHIQGNWETISIDDTTNFYVFEHGFPPPPYAYLQMYSELPVGDYPVVVTLTYESQGCENISQVWDLNIYSNETNQTNQTQNQNYSNSNQFYPMSVGSCPPPSNYYFLFLMFAIAIILIVMAEKFRLRIFGILAGFTFLMIYPFIAACQILLTSVVAFIGIILLFYYFLAP